MHRISPMVKEAFIRSTPEGWQIESIVFMPIIGWDTDVYVCRITDGINTRYLTNDGGIHQIAKKDINARIKEYQRLHDESLAWLKSES